MTNKVMNHCEECGMAFKKLEHLQRHTRTHTNDRPYVCSFPTCGKAFARQDTLNRHARLHSRDSNSEGPKPRARKRTKSMSDSMGTKKTATAPYASISTATSLTNPPLTRRQSDVTGNRKPVITTGFQFEAGDLAPVSPPVLSSSLASNSRYSTYELLGLSNPAETMQSPASMYSPLPTLSELYPVDALSPTAHQNFALPLEVPSPMSGAFSTFQPLTSSLFPSAASLQTGSPVLSTHPLESEYNAHAVASPFFSGSDDGSSNSSDPSLFAASSFSSSLATSLGSYDKHDMMRKSLVDFSTPSSVPNRLGGVRPSGIAEDDYMSSLLRATDLSTNAFGWQKYGSSAPLNHSILFGNGSLTGATPSSLPFTNHYWQGIAKSPPTFTTLPSYPPINPMPLRPDEQSFDWWGSTETTLESLSNMSTAIPPSPPKLGLDIETLLQSSPQALN